MVEILDLNAGYSPGKEVFIKQPDHIGLMKSIVAFLFCGNSTRFRQFKVAECSFSVIHLQTTGDYTVAEKLAKKKKKKESPLSFLHLWLTVHNLQVRKGKLKHLLPFCLQ